MRKASFHKLKPLKVELNTLSDDDRTLNIRNNIILSFILKALAMASGFLVIPLALNKLGASYYGIFLTIISVVSWLVTFDIGIGNGLRNKLSESLSEGNLTKSRSLISTAYFSILCLCIIISVLIIIIFPVIDWNQIFNTELISPSEFKKTMYVLSLGVTLNFFLSIINQVINAFQKPAYTNFINLFHSILFLISLLLINDSLNLLNITIYYTISLIIGSLSVTTLFFNRNRKYIPRWGNVDLNLIKDIMRLGGGFFIIQITTLLMFSITNYLIIQFLTEEDVTIYNIAYRLFSVSIIIFSTIITPYWSAFTEANNKNDFRWMKISLLKLHKRLLFITILSIIILSFRNIIIRKWIGEESLLPSTDSAILMVLYSFIINWSNIYSHFLNGIGKIKGQIIVSIVQAVLVIPVCWYLTQFQNLGLSGIIGGLIFSMIPFALYGPITTYRLFVTTNA